MPLRLRKDRPTQDRVENCTNCDVQTGERPLMYGSTAVDITQYPSQSFHRVRNPAVVIIHMVRAVVAILMFLASFAAGLWLATTLARADGAPLPIVGQWTLNKDLSDLPLSA